ncbi:hypothetical protein SAE01_17520 [Segetibacter aerophilus]|uniref:Peptidase S1 domain-containing protein n=2 Tax=Segetibacter aerophilus TaxID=670293 RepID=A0A512BBA8_9BACT|nr:hypothetical protein SAE01_17520 [Segetibacter aerophilus]
MSGCSGQEKTSTKVFENIALVNNIEFYNSKLDQPRFSCGFLLQFNQDTFAVTAKHLLKVIKPEEMKTLSFDNIIKSWSLYPLNRKAEVVVTDSLLNTNKREQLEDKSTFTNDWLIFSLKANHSKVKVLTARATPLVAGEKLYVVGWTRKMESGEQRVYEFEYLKTVGHRILLKEIVVPEQFGGLSGAPLVDVQGAVVGIVSNGTVDPETNKKYFSPCVLNELTSFIENYQKK